MNHVSAIIVAANTVTLLFGTFVTLLAYRAYRRTDSPALRALAVGLGLVTVGTIAGGVLHQVTPTSLVTSIAVHSCFTAAGFVVLAYSLYADHGRHPPRTKPPSRLGE